MTKPTLFDVQNALSLANYAVTDAPLAGLAQWLSKQPDVGGALLDLAALFRRAATEFTPIGE